MNTKSGKNKCGLAATLILVMVCSLTAKEVNRNVANGEVIQPNVHGGEAFTFAAQGVVEGEVISVKTVEGEVVATAKADRYGRVFLPAGLASGVYSVVAPNGVPRRGSLSISPGNPVVRQELIAMNLQSVPEAIDLRQPVHLTGQGFNPNAAEMTVNGAPVMAATENELVAAPLSQAPGMIELRIENNATGETVMTKPVLGYTLDGNLERTTLTGGDATVLRLQAEPKNNPPAVEARILNGPASFGNGMKSAQAHFVDGQAMLPIVADKKGLGAFSVAWNLLAPADATPRGRVQAKAIACAAAGALTPNSKNRKELAAEAEKDDAYAKDDSKWDKDGKPTNDKDLTDFLNAEIVRLQKIATREGNGAAKGKIAEAITAAYEAGSAAGLKLTDGKK